jgi:hypothetical protein
MKRSNYRLLPQNIEDPAVSYWKDKIKEMPINSFNYYRWKEGDQNNMNTNTSGSFTFPTLNQSIADFASDDNEPTATESSFDNANNMFDSHRRGGKQWGAATATSAVATTAASVDDAAAATTAASTGYTPFSDSDTSSAYSSEDASSYATTSPYSIGDLSKLTKLGGRRKNIPTPTPAATTYSPTPTATTYSPTPTATTYSPTPTATTYSPTPTATTYSPTLTQPKYTSPPTDDDNDIINYDSYNECVEKNDPNIDCNIFAPNYR